MLPEYLMNICRSKSSGELQVGNWSHHGQNTRTPLKPPLETSTYQQSEGEQISLDQAKWRGLIRWSAGEYKVKRISEPEQKCAQRKARAKTFSDLYCSICNRLRFVSSAILEYINNNISPILIGNGHCP